MPDSDSLVVITVLRTGGFAGMRRMWRVSPDTAEQPEWVELISRCPWDADPGEARSPLPDRFTWRIHARARDVEHTAELGESALQGAWRQLVERVREDGAPVPRDAMPGGTGPASPVI